MLKYLKLLKITLTDFSRESCADSRGVIVSEGALTSIINGQTLGESQYDIFRDPASFYAGEVHAHTHFLGEGLGSVSPTDHQAEVLDWIRNRSVIISLFPAILGYV